MHQNAMSTSEKQPNLAAGFLERMIPLGKAASLLGIDTRTLRRWLEDECGLAFPRLGRGASPLVKIADIHAVIGRHQGRQKYSGTSSADNPQSQIPNSKLQTGGAS